jgi:hypothetical protein
MDKPYHTRPMPPEWPSLTAYAEKVVPADIPPHDTVARRPLSLLLRHTAELSDEQLETNCYYGLGELMCGVRGLLDVPHLNAMVIRGGAKGMIRTALGRRGNLIAMDEPFVPVIGDLLGKSEMRQPMSAITGMAWRALPAPRRTLIDALDAAMSSRRGQAADTIEWAEWAQYLEMSITARRRPTIRHSTANTFTGAGSMLATIIAGTTDLTKEKQLQPILPALQQACQERSIISAALLRLDEFEDGLWVGSGEAFHFDHDLLAAPPRPLKHVKNPRHLHEQRLICPAVQAGGLARYSARVLLPAIVTTAAAFTPSQWYEAKPKWWRRMAA